MIPEMAKDWKWYDSHFNITHSDDNNIANNLHNDIIIAVFDIDHNTVNQYMNEGWIYCVYGFMFGVGLYHVVSIILLDLVPSKVNEILSKAAMIILIVLLVEDPYSFRVLCHRYFYIHLAIATDGIYIDERNKMNPKRYDRTIIPYDAICKCDIHSYRYYFHYYLHVVFLDADGKIINSLLNCFYDIHQFVDIVNVMMEKSLSTTNSPAAINPPMVPNDTNDEETAGIV